MSEYIEIFTKDFLNSIIPKKDKTLILNDIIESMLNNLIYANITNPAVDRIVQKISPLSTDNNQKYIVNPLASYVADKMYISAKLAYIASYNEEIRREAFEVLNIKK